MIEHRNKNQETNGKGHHSIIGGNIWVTHNVSPNSRIQQSKAVESHYDGGLGIQDEWKKGGWKKEESLILTTPTNKPSSFIHKPSSKLTVILFTSHSQPLLRKTFGDIPNFFLKEL